MKIDILSRRLRFAPPNPQARPVRAPKHIVLSEADYLIFQAINRHGPLPTDYLYEFAKSERGNFLNHQRRLTEFYNGDEGGPYLTRPEQQHAGYSARYQPLVYDLAPRARNALSERGLLALHAPARTAPFLHQLMQACVAASIELTAGKKGLRYISREEILTHSKCPQATQDAKNPLAIPLSGIGSDQKVLIPDDLFAIEYPEEGFRFFAVEIDRNTESIERKNLEYNTFGKKVVGYHQVLRDRLFKEWWGIANLTILTVTTNRTHAQNILDHVRKTLDPSYGERFLIQTEEAFGVNWRVPKGLLSHLLDEPWYTVGTSRDITKP